jgi:Holliday junction DNA helicase RuvA
MIGKLKGQVDEIGEDHVLLDVHGVGYLVYAPARVLQGLPSPGEAAVLHIETIVREDLIRLYGFSSATEKAWFQLLMTVQGVGAKVALAALGVLRASEQAQAAVTTNVGDAVSALVNLGYQPAQASAAVAAAVKSAGDEAETATLIRLGLKELAR